jgi:NB-ARC domain
MEDFGRPAWVTISQNYNLLEVLKKITKSFEVVDPTNLDANDLAKEINEHLKQRKFLIVLDDVWTEKLCDELKKVLPNTKNGSRVLITTRSTDVARFADTTYEPYQLDFLEDKESLKLFLKNAIPKMYQSSEDPSPEYPSPPGLKDLPDKFIKKCKGLPLALIVLGRLLSTKPYNYHEWQKLLETMNWKDDAEDCIKVIATSFEHLPFARKFCFMYFAAFLEDQEIEAQALLWMWIAEGLIPPEKGRTLEATAERFLEDLVQRYDLHLFC